MTIKGIKHTALILAVLLTSALLLGGCGQKSPVFETRRDDIVSSLSVTGKVQSSKRSLVCGSYPLKFSQVRVSPGDTIKRGDVLASLDQEYIHAQMDEASAQMSAALQYIAMIQNSRTIVRVVRAPVGGTIKAVRIDSNSSFDNNDFDIGNPAMLISTKDEMFCWIDASEEAGQAVTVQIGDEQVVGTVDKVEDGKSKIIIPSDLFPVGAEVDVFTAGNTYKATLFLSEYTPIHLEYGKIRSVNVKENQEIAYMTGLFEVNQYDNEFYENKKEFEQAQSMYNYYADLETHLDYLSDFDGIVNTAPVVSNELQPGETMFEISSDDNIVVKLSVDEFDINRVRAGQIVKLSSKSANQENFECTITSVSQLAVENKNANNPWATFEVTAVPNNDDMDLRIGSSVYGKIIDEKAENVLVVPLRAIHHSSDMTKQYVYANIDQTSPYYGKAGNELPGNAVIVKTGIQDNYFIEITYGLEEGLEVFID